MTIHCGCSPTESRLSSIMNLWGFCSLFLFGNGLRLDCRDSRTSADAHFPRWLLLGWRRRKELQAHIIRHGAKECIKYRLSWITERIETDLNRTEQREPNGADKELRIKQFGQNDDMTKRPTSVISRYSIKLYKARTTNKTNLTGAGRMRSSICSMSANDPATRPDQISRPGGLGRIWK